MQKIIKKLRLALMLVMIIVPTFLFAQTDPPTPPPPGDDDNNTQDVPFDGGVSLLIAAGIGYGLKKANDKRKAKEI